MNRCLTKIISGGQTGVDQAALRAAMELGLDHGGWCPPGRVSEDGIIPLEFNLRETPQDCSELAPEVPRSLRTEWNVRDSQGSLIFIPEVMMGKDQGTAFTEKATEIYRKLVLILHHLDEPDQIAAVHWVRHHKIEILNVAGPSEKALKGIGDKTFKFLVEVFEELVKIS